MKRIYTALSLISIALVLLTSIAFAGGPEQKAASPWLIYAGAFAGYYSGDYQYGSVYFSNGANSQSFANTVFQQGFSGGAQVGFQYHFQRPYFLGFNLSAAMNANNARLTVIAVPVNPAGSVPNLNHQFRLGYNVDMAGVFGADITSQTRLYAKIGASCSELIQSITGTLASTATFPSAFFKRTEHKNLWGWVVGVGLIQELSRWVNAFVEYDRYDYGNNDFNINLLFPNNVDRLTQHVRIAASAVRLGVNVKFMNNFMPIPHLTIANPWLFYVGGFAAYYSADFKYGANYFSNLLGGSNLIINRTVFQEGPAGGGQIGFQYHFQSPYFVGFNVSGEGNADKTRQSTPIIQVPIAGVIGNITNIFRVAYNIDMAGVIGANITSRKEDYAKIGDSYAYLNQSAVSALITFTFPTPIFEKALRKNLWGWVFGVGLTQDLNRWVNAFVEYDRYDYGNNDLGIFGSIFGGGAGADRYTQHVRVTSSAVRLGLNLKFIGSFAPVSHRMLVKPWLFYLGGFAAYYSADFQYGANYFETVPTNEIYNNTIFQEGVSGGGQFGFQYHFQSPYFVGFNFSVASNANKARLSILNIFIGGGNQGISNFQFRLGTNVDIATVFGADITLHTHVYGKLGASYGRLTQTIDGTLVSLSSPIAVSERSQRKNLWGWVAGVGLTRDLCRWLNIFTEYDRYDYGTNGLNSHDLLFPGATDHLTQHVRVTSYAVRLGLNLKFEF